MNNQMVIGQDAAMQDAQRKQGAYLPRLIRLALEELSARKHGRVVGHSDERQDMALDFAQRVERMAEVRRRTDMSMAGFQANPFDMCGR